MHSYYLCLLHTHKIENICKQLNSLKYSQIIEIYIIIVLENTGIVKYKIFIHNINRWSVGSAHFTRVVYYGAKLALTDFRAALEG